MDKYESVYPIASYMADNYSTQLTWEGESHICERLVKLIPDGIKFSVENKNSISILTIDVKSESLDDLRNTVDKLLADFSDQDE